MLVRRERPEDVAGIREVHLAAFATADAAGGVPVEVALVDALRVHAAWIPALSLVAVEPDGRVVGHVVCSRAHVDGAPVLGLGPLGVRRELHGQGIGSALMHAVLGAADALDEPLAALLGHRDYYPRFGFRPATDLGILAPDPAWGDHFQVRALSAHDPSLRGRFAYAPPFDGL